MSVLKFRDSNGNFIPIRTVKGDDGRGIVEIRKKETFDDIDVYEILYTDGTTSTFEISNSKNSQYLEVDIDVANDGEVSFRNWVTENPYSFVREENDKGRSVIMKANVYMYDTLVQTAFIPQTLEYKEVTAMSNLVFMAIIDEHTQIIATLTDDNVLKIETIPFVKDNNYVHTDNNFTNYYMNKLMGLKNYDDTEIKKDIDNLELNKADRSEIPDTKDFITKHVDDLINYYVKSETYSKNEINELIKSIENVRIEKVENLPETGETNIIYLKPVDDGKDDNYYEEYVYINNNYELIGTTKIDLSNYATKNEIPTKISELDNDSDFATKSDIPTNYVTTDTSQTITKSKKFNGYVYLGSSITMLGDTNGTITMGRNNNASCTPTINMRSNATGNDYDVKITASNGGGTDGQGTLDITSAKLTHNGKEISTPIFNQDFNIKNEDGAVKTFTNTGSTIDDKYIFTQTLPTTNLYTEVIFTANEYTIVYGKGYNHLYLSKNGIDFERKNFSSAIKNIIRLVETNRLVALCNSGYFYYSDDDGNTWNSTQLSTYSTYDKVVNYLEYTDTFGVVQLSTKTLHFINNKFTRTDYLTSAITPNFTTMLNQSQIIWCDYNGNCRYKAGSREGNVTSLPSGRVNFLGKVNGVVYGGYQNDNKIAYLNGTSTTSSWGTYTLPETCTVNDIVYNAKDQTYYILTDINTYYKTKDFVTFESFEKDNIRIAKGTMTLVGLMGVSKVNAKYVYVAPTQQKIEDTLQELKRAVNKERWVGKGLELQGEVINVKGNSPVFINDYGVGLMYGGIDLGYIVPEQAEVIMSGGSYRHNLVPETVMDEIWNIWDGTPEQVINVMFTSSGSFYDPMSWETEYTVEKGDYGYFISDTYGSAMPFKKTGSLAPFFN